MWNLENRKIGDVFACEVTTSGATTKCMVPLDSARQIGLGSTSHEFSDCSNGLSKGGEVCLGGIFWLRNLGTFSLIALHTALLL